MRKLLDKYLAELELRDLGERLELLKEHLGNKVDPKLVARLVREDREMHHNSKSIEALSNRRRKLKSSKKIRKTMAYINLANGQSYQHGCRNRLKYGNGINILSNLILKRWRGARRIS